MEDQAMPSGGSAAPAAKPAGKSKEERLDALNKQIADLCEQREKLLQSAE